MDEKNKYIAVSAMEQAAFTLLQNHIGQSQLLASRKIYVINNKKEMQDGHVCSLGKLAKTNAV